MARIDHGATPNGYTSLLGVVEQAVAILWGDWATAELTVKETKQSTPFVHENGKTLYNANTIYIRDDVEIPGSIDAANWKCAREAIRELLIDGNISAFVEHPESFKEIQIPPRYWTRNNVDYDSAIEQGCYFGALDDSALEQRTIFVSDDQVEHAYSWLRRNAETFYEKDWNQVQALGWVYTRWPEIVRDASPFRKKYDGTESPRRDGVDLTLNYSVHGLPVPVSYEEAKAEFLRALRSGKIEASGIKGREGERETIPRDFWIDGDFYWGVGGQLDYASADPLGRESLRWHKVFFSSAKMLELWTPCFPLSRAGDLEDNHQTVSLTPTQVETLLKRLHWTVAETMAWVVWRDVGDITRRFSEGDWLQPEWIWIAAALDPREPGRVVEESVDQLILEACKADRLKAAGKRNGDGEYTAITPLDWSDIVFAINEDGCPAANGKHVNDDGLLIGSAEFWSDIKFERDSVIREWPKKKKQTIAGESNCKDWLLNLMSNDSPQERNKDDYKEEAFEKFSISARAFDRAWHAAILESSNENWGRPGPKIKE